MVLDGLFGEAERAALLDQLTAPGWDETQAGRPPLPLASYWDGDHTSACHCLLQAYHAVGARASVFAPPYIRPVSGLRVLLRCVLLARAGASGGQVGARDGGQRRSVKDVGAARLRAAHAGRGTQPSGAGGAEPPGEAVPGV